MASYPKLVGDGRIPRAGAIEAWGPMSGGLIGPFGGWNTFSGGHHKYSCLFMKMMVMMIYLHPL